jgi:hypothetical protein
VALKEPEPGQRARWIMSEKEASRLLWQVRRSCFFRDRQPERAGTSVRGAACSA